MLKIETETRRFVLKEGSERLFDQIVKEILGFEETVKDQEGGAKQEGYKGFLYIKCAHCGKEKGFYTKDRLRYHKCECEEKTELNDLKTLYVNCECGGRFKYLTNKQEEQFDITCIKCGQPVAVEWNQKKGIYETIQ